MAPEETNGKHEDPQSWGITVSAPTPNKTGASWLFLILGVIYPYSVVGIELTTGMCATDFFDPIPTVLHGLLVLFVPSANLAVWLVARKAYSVNPKILGIANGFALGISFYYTILFLPLMPAAAIALIIGIGVLPLAPMCSFIACWYARRYLKRTFALQRIPGTILGVAIAFVSVGALELPVTLTRIGMKMAASDDVEKSRQAVQWLRLLGDDKTLLQACYHYGNRRVEVFSLLTPVGNQVTPEKARVIYYRVTGTAYNAVPAPFAPHRRYFSRFDPEQGGTTVGGRLTDLKLSSSRIDGSLDPDAALGYLEWTMEFSNGTNRQQEARQQIILPPGGVVSRLTLWVNGEEREAAFAGRAKVREAYEKVVRAKRDPVLVTTNGPDRVLVQCFPVPPNGGTMKVRLGITVPLTMTQPDRASLRLPSISERNFSIDDSVKHGVWIEAPRELNSSQPALTAAQASQSINVVRGDLATYALQEGDAVVIATRSPEVTVARAEDGRSDPKAVVRQLMEEKAAVVPKSVVVVIDGSQALHRQAGAIAEAMSAIPDQIPVSLVIAGDIPVEFPGPSDEPVIPVPELARRVTGYSYGGGRDNVPALVRAWDVAAKKSGSAIVWVHGPQPIRISSAEPLRQRWERRPDGPVLYELSVSPSVNRVIEELDGISSVRMMSRKGTVERDLKALFASWQTGATVIDVSRERMETASWHPPEAAKKTSDHLVRLWANGHIANLAEQHKPDWRNDAMALAARYQIVTPVSGAVVLETAADFKEAGLTPAAAQTVPIIPEPETYLLIAVALLMMAWVVRERRRRCLA